MTDAGSVGKLRARGGQVKASGSGLNYRVLFEEWGRGLLRQPQQLLRARRSYECPVCGYSGWFIDAGRRLDCRCPNCSSKERDRVLGLYFRQHQITVADKRVLHFSPERPFFRQWKRYPNYVGGDVKRNRNATAIVDITRIAFPVRSFDLIICSHVLEHVKDHHRAMDECFRVLADDGTAFFSVPITEDSATTWEPPASMTVRDVERICGWDHKRRYGQDFPDMLRGHGFVVDEIGHAPDDAVRYRLSETRRRESTNRYFRARKP